MGIGDGGGGADDLGVSARTTAAFTRAPKVRAVGTATHSATHFATHSATHAATHSAAHSAEHTNMVQVT